MRVPSSCLLLALAVGGCQEAAPAPPPRTASVRAGWSHTLAVTGYALHSFGGNESGQLGQGDAQDRRAPMPIDGDWVAMAGGARHSCAIGADASLWCWGANPQAQLGVGDSDNRVDPSPVVADGAEWIAITCGGLHTCGLQRDHSLWCWGSNPAGQLGLGEGVVGQSTPQRVPGRADWLTIAARTRHVCGLREDGSLWCWGDNSNGQLGVADTIDRATPQPIAALQHFVTVGAGALHSCAIDDASALWCWGANDMGQLGHGDMVQRTTPERVGTSIGWTRVDGGFGHTCALRVGNELWCWGSNGSGQLGVGDTDKRLVPVLVATGFVDVGLGAAQSCGVRDDGSVWCWGENERGQTGAGVASSVLTPTRVDVD